MLNAGRRQGSRGPEGTAAVEGIFHQEVRRRRCARGLSRDELAERTGYSRHYVSQLEQPSKGIPPRPVVVAVDAALCADGALVALRDEAASARAEATGRGRDPEHESRSRVHDLLGNRRCDAELDYLDRTVGELIAIAGSLGPRDIRDRVLDQQEIVDGLLRTPMLPHQQLRLFLIAGHLAGLLAIALLDLGELSGACTCCLEAAVFTELTGHAGLRAWTLAVNRLVAEAARHAEALAAQPNDAKNGDLTIATEVDELAVRDLDDPYPVYNRPAAVVGADEATVSHLDFGYVGGSTAETDPVGYGTPEAPRDLIAWRVDELAAGRFGYDPPEFGAEPAGPPWRGVGDVLTAPGGRASTPLLVALVKGRIARFATTDARRERPLAGLSRAFHPPV
ncbi:helix-turn-helix domain-containing protein [Frankia sp. AgB1.9]|uniref:helix-turn-helix domain-containing protein n=1 Tax=unclassified Frankia TaxID=2632575 RepID=UPI00193489C7|nr:MULTISPECIES: helix-turn-helix transcriptional regulator [unclassified Frankia]MBL7488438.1 helix-turn-helix domain-containing protein [Frankia sp. AgW1.1]MBL7550150.1 helix-turn-helix domain-containing protein [Frankia sp. AgB1.9]MBL7624999.1 helix-turn-helix domain-containing protein [Frankia sp. AgB1.8]